VSLGSDEWVGGAGGDPALVVLVPGHPDVSLVSPVLGPGVLDQPVVLSVEGAVADDQDAVVESLGIALGRPGIHPDVQGREAM